MQSGSKESYHAMNASELLFIGGLSPKGTLFSHSTPAYSMIVHCGLFHNTTLWHVEVLATAESLTLTQAHQALLLHPFFLPIV